MKEIKTRIRICTPNFQSLSIDAHEADVNAVCFVDETTHIVASGQGCQYPGL